MPFITLQYAFLGAVAVLVAFVGYVHLDRFFPSIDMPVLMENAEFVSQRDIDGRHSN